MTRHWCPSCTGGGDVVTDGARGDRCVICGWLSPGYERPRNWWSEPELPLWGDKEAS